MPEYDPAAQRQFAHDVVRYLREAGYQALWAGGCVRDTLLKKTPKDYDVATDARPEQVRALFGKRRTLPVGEAFGVIMVRGPEQAGPLEVATFRQDAGYSDGRHPDSVRFCRAEDDAARRDFTINGMFFDPTTEQVLDYVGGQADLAAHTVRAIGDPRERFREDKLRMLRAVRFAAVLDFQLEPATLAAIRDMAREIHAVSAERIQAELQKMLLSPRRKRALELFRESGLLREVLPELDSLPKLLIHSELPHFHDLRMEPPIEPPAGRSAWELTLALLEELREPSFPLVWAALVAYAGWPAGDPVQTHGFWLFPAAEQLVTVLGRRWKTSLKDEQRAAWLVRNRAALVGASRRPWSQVQRLLIHEASDDLLDLWEAEITILKAPHEDLEYCRARKRLPASELNPRPLLSGHDLAAQGLAPGPAFRTILERVRDAQLDGRLQDPAAALAFALDLTRQLPPVDPQENS